MPDNRSRKLIPAGTGFIGDISLRIKLIARLVADPRVSIFAKLLPIGTLIYLIVPDLIPSAIDDAMLMWLGNYLFVELCPQNVVEEHMNALLANASSSKKHFSEGGEDIIDAEYWEEKKSE